MEFLTLSSQPLAQTVRLLNSSKVYNHEHELHTVPDAFFHLANFVSPGRRSWYTGMGVTLCLADAGFFVGAALCGIVRPPLHSCHIRFGMCERLQAPSTRIQIVVISLLYASSHLAKGRGNENQCHPLPRRRRLLRGSSSLWHHQAAFVSLSDSR